MIAIVDIGGLKRAEESLRLRSQELEALVHIAGTLVQPGSFEDKCTEVIQDLASIAQAMDFDSDKRGFIKIYRSPKHDRRTGMDSLTTRPFRVDIEKSGMLARFLGVGC